MSGSAETHAVIKKYLLDLTSNYKTLIKILEFEHDDIENSDEVALSEHARLESETVLNIIRLTKAIYIYLEEVRPDNGCTILLDSLSGLKETASTLSKTNIDLLSGELARLKSRLSANKLPKTARRVYYAGETPTMMDIEI